MIHDIQIKRKYTLDGKIKWYTDQNNIRYTRDDILYIINNGKVPDRLSIIYGFKLTGNKILPNAKINMIVTKGSVLRSTKGIVEVQSVHNRHKICVINEDSNSGYILCYNLLTRMFPEVDFDFVPANGNTTLLGTVNKQLKTQSYEKYILITDNKDASLEYRRQITNSIISIKNNNKHVISIYPSCIEEMLLSWKELKVKNNSIYCVKLQDYFNTGSIPYVYIKDDNYDFYLPTGRTRIHNLEKVLYTEIYSCSTFEYLKSSLNRCIYTNCCNFMLEQLNINFKSRCKNSGSTDKVKSIFENSLFGSLYNAVYILEYGKEKYLQHWSEQQRKTLYMIY